MKIKKTGFSNKKENEIMFVTVHNFNETNKRYKIQIYISQAFIFIRFKVSVKIKNVKMINLRTNNK